jgi:phospholipid/cholesterol/gamma-HCH transport system substrate-binding protein
MARRLSWSDVRGGLIAIVAIAVVSFVVLKFARVGALRGNTIHLYALVGEARGVLKGSEVWLMGQKIGKITAINFRSPTVADTSSRIEIAMEVLAEYRPIIRRDAEAQIRNGGTIIGAPVVYMMPGTPKAPEIRDGDTVRTKPQPDVEGATGRFGAAAREFPVIISNVKVLAAELQTTHGTIGAFLNTPEGSVGAGLSHTRLQASRLGAQLGSRGTVGRFMEDGLSTRATRVMARVDSVRALLASPNTSFGRFRRDSTLLSEVADIRNELSIIQALVDEPRGTAGRVLRDSAITSALAGAQREMSLLFADIKKHPLRYLSF